MALASPIVQRDMVWMALTIALPALAVPTLPIACVLRLALMDGELRRVPTLVSSALHWERFPIITCVRLIAQLGMEQMAPIIASLVVGAPTLITISVL